MAKKQRQQQTTRKANTVGGVVESSNGTAAASLSSSLSSAAAPAALKVAVHNNDPSRPLVSIPDQFLPRAPVSSFVDWIRSQRQSLIWILGCALVGAFLGFSVGAGWLTNGYGSWHVVLKDPIIELSGGQIVKQEFSRKFVITPWRLAAARRIRDTLLYDIITFRKAPWAIFEYLKQTYNTDGTWWWAAQHPHPVSDSWFAASPMWPPNWILFRQVDLSNVDVGEGGLSPAMVKFLSLILPWRRSLITALARKEKPRGAPPLPMDDREEDGDDDSHLVNYGASSPTSFSSRIKSLLFPSTASIYGSAPVDPYYHQLGFYTLREYIIRLDHGYVHPDLGFLIPAPSGAARGLGMVSDSYNRCQRHCFPGTVKEREDEERVKRKNIQKLHEQQMAEQEIMDEMKEEFPELSSESSAEGVRGISQPPRPSSDSSAHQNPVPMRNITSNEGTQASLHHKATSTSKPYSQHELLLHIPLEAQITRSSALEILKSIIPEEVMNSQIADLDDAFILTILLAHEKGRGDASRFWPYIATLPSNPTCALYPSSRQSVVDVVTALAVEMGTDVVGWPSEIAKAAEVAERIVGSLSMQYKSYLVAPDGGNLVDSIRWALCQVASRAVAGKERYGRLRLVPMMDLINHDEAADKFHELVGNETSNDADSFFLHAEESDAGAFIVRSRRYGRSKPLKKGQELMANYNVPHYSPLDWFINMGFVPPERTGKWKMLESGLPSNYRGGLSRKSTGAVVTGIGAFGSGKPEIQVIRQHTTHATQLLQHQQPQTQQSQQQQVQQQQTCQR